jgi:sec-independent protein translocase protein TatA
MPRGIRVPPGPGKGARRAPGAAHPAEEARQPATLRIVRGKGCCLPFGIGPLELIIVLVIILVIFGPKRLPGVGRSLGQGMREFKDSLTGKDKEEEESRAELSGGEGRVEQTTASGARSDEGSRVGSRDE